MLHYKAGVAALFLAIVIAVGGSIQAGAVKNNGFFFWLNRDETGTEMITSPEMLTGETGAKEAQHYYNRDDMPEWTQGWLKIEEKYEMPESFECKYFEVDELDFVKYVVGHYSNSDSEQEIRLGVYIYAENTFYNRDGFANFNYVDSYNVDQKQMDIYNKIEDTGDILYTICFFESKCKYYVSMKDNLEELKIFAEQYWDCVKKDL